MHDRALGRVAAPIGGSGWYPAVCSACLVRRWRGVPPVPHEGSRRGARSVLRFARDEVTLFLSLAQVQATALWRVPMVWLACELATRPSHRIGLRKLLPSAQLPTPFEFELAVLRGGGPAVLRITRHRPTLAGIQIYQHTLDGMKIYFFPNAETDVVDHTYVAALIELMLAALDPQPPDRIALVPELDAPMVPPVLRNTVAALPALRADLGLKRSASVVLHPEHEQGRAYWECLRRGVSAADRSHRPPSAGVRYAHILGWASVKAQVYCRSDPIDGLPRPPEPGGQAFITANELSLEVHTKHISGDARITDLAQRKFEELIAPELKEFLEYPDFDAIRGLFESAIIGNWMQKHLRYIRTSVARAGGIRQYMKRHVKNVEVNFIRAHDGVLDVKHTVQVNPDEIFRESNDYGLVTESIMAEYKKLFYEGEWRAPDKQAGGNISLEYVAGGADLNQLRRHGALEPRAGPIETVVNWDT